MYLRKKAKAYWLFIFLFTSCSSSFYFIHLQQTQNLTTASDYPVMRDIEKRSINNTVQVLAPFQVSEPKTIQVVLERIYLDGEISEEILEETILSMEDFWAEYAEWELIDLNESQVLFQQKVNDISPLLKLNGYFGISKEGTLNIYEGKPSEDKVIQSFFQINMKKLKSHQQQELEDGIPVLSKDRYEEVLNLFKKYAIHKI